MLDAEHLITLVAMETLARSHPKSVQIALFDVRVILHDLLLILSFLFYDPIWKQLP
jgi:hypothetical protein